jgi:pyruvate dehydrogenase E1 component
MTESASFPASEGSDERIEHCAPGACVWLATSIVITPTGCAQTPSGVKVAGHQAVVGLDGRHHDRAVLRPPAGAGPGVGKAARLPVLHAINYLLGRLDGRYLTELRAFGGCRAIPAGPRIPTPWTSPRAPWGSAPRRRSGARSPTGTSQVTSTCRAGGGRSRSWATPSSTRARSGRPSSIPSCLARGGPVDRRPSTASRWTGWSPDIAAGAIRLMFEAAGLAHDHRQVRPLLEGLFERPGRRGAARAHRPR